MQIMAQKWIDDIQITLFQITNWINSLSKLTI